MLTMIVLFSAPQESNNIIDVNSTGIVAVKVRRVWVYTSIVWLIVCLLLILIVLTYWSGPRDLDQQSDSERSVEDY